MTSPEPNKEIGELLDTRQEDKQFHQAKGAIEGALNKAVFEAELEENPGKFQTAIDSQWPAFHIVGVGDVDRNGSLTLANVAKPGDFSSIVFENGWVFYHGQWFHDDQFTKYVSERQKEAEGHQFDAKEKEQDAIQDWSGICQFEYGNTEINGEYLFDKTGFHGSASQVVAHAAGYHRAIKEVLQTEDN